MTEPTEVTLHGTRLARWLGIESEQSPLVYAQVYEGAEISQLNYWMEIIFAAGIAIFGLVLNSPAVIIGAMLISPLMGPLMAAGLALAAGDLYLLLKSSTNLAASIVLSIVLSAAVVWLLPFHAATAEVMARTNPNLLDLGVAVFSGLAGSMAVIRSGRPGGITTLPGVAIAVALMPPLCTIGFGLGSGMDKRIMGGAGLLFLTNLVAIVASAFVVFLLAGMNAPEVRSKLEISRQGELLAERIAHGPFARVLINGAQLRWRILVLAVLLAAIAVPLRRAFSQLASEAKVRGAVQNVVKGLLPQSALVSQQTEVGRSGAAVRVVATESISANKIAAAEEEIQRRSGQRISLSVATIASRDELDRLSARLIAPRQETAPHDETIQEMNEAVLKRLIAELQTLWPPETPIESFSLSFGTNGQILHVDYRGVKSLDKITLGMIERTCRQQLKAPDLVLDAQRIARSHARNTARSSIFPLPTPHNAQ
jgi:uncharacterized hydrophobic protein (TIGR00271 family)